MRQMDKKSVHKQHIKLQMARGGHRVIFICIQKHTHMLGGCKLNSSAHARSELAKYLPWHRRAVDVKLSILLI